MNVLHHVMSPRKMSTMSRVTQLNSFSRHMLLHHVRHSWCSSCNVIHGCRRAARRVRAGSLYNLGIRVVFGRQSGYEKPTISLTELDLLDSESSQAVVTSNILIPMLVKLQCTLQNKNPLAVLSWICFPLELWILDSC